MTLEPELLDIGQAAALLQVSEASLRRWTNRGLLPCLRIGGRRERRFRRTDLVAFVESHAAPPLGHLCGLYTSELGRARQAARLLGDGLGAGSVCFLAAQPDVRERILTRLARRRPSLRRALDDGSLILMEYADAAAVQLANWATRFAAATQSGARSIRVVGDVSGAPLAQGKAFDGVLEYEAAYARLSRRFPVATVCMYDARVHSGLETAAVLSVHPDLFRQPVAHILS